MEPTGHEIKVFAEQVGQCGGPKSCLRQGEVDGKDPVRRRLQECQLNIGREDEDRLGVLDLESIQRKLREGVANVRRQMPALESEGVHRPAGFQNELDSLVAELALGGIAVAVRGDFNSAKVNGKGVRFELMNPWLSELLVCVIFEG